MSGAGHVCDPAGAEPLGHDQVAGTNFSADVTCNSAWIWLIVESCNSVLLNPFTLWIEARGCSWSTALPELLDVFWGLTNAYRSPSGLYKTGKTLYLYIRNGWKTWKYKQRHFRLFIKVTYQKCTQHRKYKDVINELKKSPEITRLVSHVPQIIYNPPIYICIYPFVPQPNKKWDKMKKMILKMRFNGIKCLNMWKSVF